MKRAIFISYRRDDAEGEAGRLFDDLVRAYGDDSVFMDVAGIAPGTDFRKAIDDNVATCGVFLAVMGPNWPTVTNPDGTRRLDDPNDFVRLEVGSALTRNIAVIPVLVHDARMPHPEQLPESIKELAFRNSVEISHARWNSDVQLLIAALKQYVTTTPATETQPVHATVPTQLPPPVVLETPDRSKKLSQPMLIGGMVAAVLLVVAVIAFIAWPKQNQQQTGAASAQPVVPGQQGAGNAPAAAGALAATWTNPHTKKGTDALTELKISGAGPQYTVEPFGACGQNLCSWGPQTLTFDGTKMLGKWSLENIPNEVMKSRVATILLVPTGGNLAVETQNTWVNPSGQPEHNGFKYEFVRAQ